MTGAGEAAVARSGRSSSVLLDGRFEGGGVGSLERFDDGSVLEEEESRHGGDTESLGEFWSLVDVEFTESSGSVDGSGGIAN